MVEEVVDYLKSAFEIFLNQVFHLAFFKHVVVSMVDGGLLLLVSLCRLDETRLFGFFFLSLVVGVLQVPFDEYVLLLELLVLLLISPDVD